MKCVLSAAHMWVFTVHTPVYSVKCAKSLGVIQAPQAREIKVWRTAVSSTVNMWNM